MTKLVFNERLPSSIRRALTAEAKARDVKLNDVAGEALASYFGMKWKCSGEPYRRTAARTDKIRVPENLHRRVRSEAFRIEQGTMRGVVLSILADNLGVELTVPTTRRPRKGT